MPLRDRVRRVLNQAQKFSAQRSKFRAGYTAPRVNDDVPSCWYLPLVAAHDFAHAPPDAVAHHRLAECLLDAESVAALRQRVCAKKNGEVGAGAAAAGAINGVKLAAPHQARPARKLQAPRVIRA